MNAEYLHAAERASAAAKHEACTGLQNSTASCLISKFKCWALLFAAMVLIRLKEGVPEPGQKSGRRADQGHRIIRVTRHISQRP